MKFIKRNFVFVVGLAVLVLAAFVFFSGMKSQSNLEDGELRAWKSASEARRAAAVKILTGSEDNTEIMVACLDKMAVLPDSGPVKIRDAASLCLVGIMLKDNL